MIKYFRELLATLKSIDARLKRFEELIDSPPSHHSRGYKKYLRTGHWND